MKRTLSLVLALVMILGSFSAVFAAEAVDTTVVKAAGEFLKSNNILEGDKGDLMLDANLKRRDAVVLLSRLIGEEKEAKVFPSENLAFTDITDNHYKGYLAWSVSKGIVEGHTPTKFGFNEELTAQQFAAMLLRVLGHEVKDPDYPKALETAKKLGLLKDLEVENKTIVSRGVMAVMTFNALGVEVKDTGKTLAETLKIEMPAAKDLKVEVKDTENLKEIVVELSNAKLADEDKLQNANNYKLTGFVVQKAELKGNDVILLLKGEDALVKGREYELVIRGIEKAVNGKYKFVAKDNTIPAVEKVEVLGEYGIKVTTTEPISDAKERNFLVDGKNVSMKIEQYGRDIIITPYYKASFSNNAKTLTIKELKDFAGYKSVEKDFEIEVKKDEVAPKVVDVISRGNKIEVIFDKDVQKDSVDAYSSRSDAGNISYESGRHTVYATEAEKVDTNKVIYTFKDELPRKEDVTIVDVANHSKVKMEKTTMGARLVLDNTEPELIDKKVKTDYDGKSATITLYFDKNVEGSFEKGSKTEFVTKDHFALYDREVYKRNDAKHGDIKSAEYDTDKNKDLKKDVIVVKVENLKQYVKADENDYVLEIFNFTDESSTRNKMYRDYVDFKVSKTSEFAVEKVSVYKGRNREDVEVTIEFNKSADIVTAENPTNYIFQDGTSKDDVRDLKGKVVLEGNGKKVTLILPNFDLDDYKELRILDALKDKDGKRLDKTVIYDFESGLLLNVGQTVDEKSAKDVDDKINALPKAEEIKSGDKEAIEEARAAYNKLTEKQKKLVKNLEKLVAAEAKITAGSDLELGIANLKAKLVEANKLYETDKRDSLAKAILEAKIVLENKQATLANVNEAINALQAAINGVEAPAQLAKAKEAVAKAEKSELKADIEAAQALVTALTEGSDKAELQKRITAITFVNEALQEKLATAKAAANSNVKEDFTPESWKAFEAALEAAIALPEATKAEVNAKIAAINAAVDMLDKKVEEKELTAEATTATLVGRTGIKIILSDNAEMKNIKEVKVNGKIEAHILKSAEVRVTVDVVVETVEVIMEDGTIVPVVLR